MSRQCELCGVEKKSNKGVLCRLCSNIKTGKNVERNKKLSLRNTGRKNTIKAKQRMSKARLDFFKNGGIHPNKGLHLSEETKRKIRLANSGENNHRWKGGRMVNAQGYIWEYCLDSKMASSSMPNYVLQHRLAMARHIGRDLLSSEIVHHINGVRDDNRIENLVLTTASKHAAEHNSSRIWKESSKNKQRIMAEKMKDKKSGRFINLTK